MLSVSTLPATTRPHSPLRSDALARAILFFRVCRDAAGQVDCTWPPALLTRTRGLALTRFVLRLQNAPGSAIPRRPLEHPTTMRLETRLLLAPNPTLSDGTIRSGGSCAAHRVITFEVIVQIVD